MSLTHTRFMTGPTEPLNAQISDMARRTTEISIEDRRVLQVFRDNIGMMMRECREGKFTVSDLSGWLGVDRQNIYNWRDGTEPHLRHLDRLRRLWGLDFTQPIEEGSFSRLLPG